MQKNKRHNKHLGRIDVRVVVNTMLIPSLIKKQYREKISLLSVFILLRENHRGEN